MLKTNKWLLVSLGTVAALAILTIRPNSIDAGYEGVIVKKPWFFGHGGVEEKPVQTGLVWRVTTTSIISINIKPYNIDEVFDDLITADNNPVDFKIHLTLKNISGRTPELVAKWGPNWYKNKLREPLRNTARSFTKAKKMFEMTTNPDTIYAMEEEVTKTVRKFMKDEDIPVELLKATVGKVIAPKKVIEATIATAVQKQNVKTQTERVKAEKAREQAEIAAANADKAYAKTFGLTSQQYLDMKNLENNRLAIEAAKNGKININMIMGNAQPMFNVSK